MPKKDDPIDYRAVSAELDDLLAQLQNGELSIDEAVPAYERGHKLVKDLEGYLKSAENRVRTIQAKFKDT